LRVEFIFQPIGLSTHFFRASITAFFAAVSARVHTNGVKTILITEPRKNFFNLFLIFFNRLPVRGVFTEKTQGQNGDRGEQLAENPSVRKGGEVLPFLPHQNDLNALIRNVL
jgi:hypothetical protein